MIITKEHLEAMVQNYISKNGQSVQLIGYSDGLVDMIEFIEKKLKEDSLKKQTK